MTYAELKKSGRLLIKKASWRDDRYIGTTEDWLVEGSIYVHSYYETAFAQKRNYSTEYVMPLKEYKEQTKEYIKNQTELYEQYQDDQLDEIKEMLKTL